MPWLLRGAALTLCWFLGSLEWGYSSDGFFPYIGVLMLCVVCFPGVLRLQANLKKFMEYVQMLNTEKVCRLLEKGLDPNFHDPDTGGEIGLSRKGWMAEQGWGRKWQGVTVRIWAVVLLGGHSK